MNSRNGGGNNPREARTFSPQAAGVPAREESLDSQQLMRRILQLEGGAESSDRQYRELLDLVNQLGDRMGIKEAERDWPFQWRHGLVRYPDMFPYPMTFSMELTTAAGGAYGVTNDMVRARIQLDQDNPIILYGIGFALYKTNAAGNTEPIGTYLPLSAMQNPFFDPGAGAMIYTGRDFQWRVSNQSDNLYWQEGWRPSSMCDTPWRYYRLPCEFEFPKDDILVVEAQPIAPVPVVPQTYVLEINLHVYKMLARQRRIVRAS